MPMRNGFLIHSPNGPIANGGYCFFETLCDFRVELPIELDPHHRIERATQEQLAYIRELLRHHHFGNMASKFETDRDPNGLVRTCPEADWRYFVLTFDQHTGSEYGVQRLANLLRPRIHLYGSIRTSDTFGKGERIGWDLIPFGRHLETFAEKIEIIDHNFIDRLKSEYERYKAFDWKKHAGINRAFDLYNSIDELPGMFRFLGLFSIIEMILTHEPGERETGDSTMHQLRTKLALMNARMDLKFDYSPFGGATSKKIWDALYSVRSDIAHGNEIEVAPLLGSLKVALSFLEDAVAQLLLHALREPDLFDQLKPV